LRRLTFRAYDFARRAWHAPFTSLDQKLTVILRELSRRIDELSEKSDHNLWTLSEKLDRCGVGINTAHSDIVAVAKRTELIQERAASLAKLVEFVPQHIGEVAHELTRVMEERFAAVAVQADRQTADVQKLAEAISDLSREVSRLANAQENANSAYRRPPVLLGGNNIFMTEVDGFIVGQPGEEWRMAAFHALRGVMEPGLVRRLQQLLRPGMTFVDVGANIGIMTLHAAARVAPNGKVYSFEPAPRTFAILKDNIQVNGLLETGLIELYPLAVSDVEGQASLSIYSDNSGHNTLFGQESDSRVHVSTVTLDSLLGHRRVDLVKIDAEGAEPLILRGMEQILHANPEIVILIEFAPSHLRRAGVEPAGFLEHLQSSGFAIRVVDDATGELREADFRQLAETFSVNLELTQTR
jgi:FkbM family methyltransferase